MLMPTLVTGGGVSPSSAVMAPSEIGRWTFAMLSSVSRISAWSSSVSKSANPSKSMPTRTRSRGMGGTTVVSISPNNVRTRFTIVPSVWSGGSPAASISSLVKCNWIGTTTCGW